jgi:hypothetical protein
MAGAPSLRADSGVVEAQVVGDAAHPTPQAEAGRRARPVPLPLAPIPTRDAHDRPLRIEALAERRPHAASEPPIVHVTIDRIDVRLPTADATPATRERRPRTASAVAPLSDYLRGTQRGGHG